MQELIGTTVTLMKKKVNQIFGEFKEGVANDMSFTEALDFCDALRDPFADMPENSQLEYLKEKGALVSPVDKVLGERYVAQLNIELVDEWNKCKRRIPYSMYPWIRF